MSISDRLDEIRDRYVEWHQDRGNHTPAPDTDTWADADHPDESMDHCIVRNDVPAMLAALRAVLDLCELIEKAHEANPSRTYEQGMEVAAHKIRTVIAAALGGSRGGSGADRGYRPGARMTAVYRAYSPSRDRASTVTDGHQYASGVARTRNQLALTTGDTPDWTIQTGHVQWENP